MLQKVKNYLLVAKPGIIIGNLISAAAGFFLAARGRVDIFVLLSTLVGISLVIASACIFNNCLDRDIDRKMARTSNRPLAKGLIPIKGAICYAAILGMVGVVLLWAATNPLSVAIVMVGFWIYVGLYSMYLKRRSVYAALVGSLAGAAPPVAGYCAAGNRFDLGALLLLLIFSLWQMPHCYAIAIFRLDDYAAAQLPALPVKRGATAAKRQIVGYTLAFLVAAVMPTIGGYTGYRYLAVAATLGLFWLRMACSGMQTADDRRWAKKLFVFSFVAIFGLSIMMSIDYAAPPSSDLLLTYVP